MMWMFKNPIGRLASLLVFLALSVNGVKSEELQIGVSTDVVPVDSSFSGTQIFVFGSIDNADALDFIISNYSIIVAITGPKQDLIVRKKERVLGVWANAHSRTYTDVPSYYSVVSSLPLGTFVQEDVLKSTKLGVDNIEYNLRSSGDNTFISPEPEFSSALRRIRLGNELFSENSKKVSYLGKSLFKAEIDLPANVPIGRHVATTYLFRDNQLLDKKSVSFVVRKVGFERWLFELAHKNSLLYGIMAVLLAIFTGWAANVIFRKD